MTGRSRVAGALAVHGAPAEIIGGHGLGDADYSDRFALATDVGADAEQWARAMLGHVPDLGQRLIFAGICRFRLRRHVRSDLIAGLTVLDRSPHHVRLGLFGPVLTGRLTVTTAPGAVVLVTQMRYPTRRGRLIWRFTSPIHRKLAPALLYDAESRLRRQPTGFRPPSGERS